MQDAYAEPDNDTRNLAGFMLAVAVQDVQDMPPVFTKAPPVTILNNTLQKVRVLLLDNCLTQNCVILGYYAASSGTFYRPIGFHLQGTSSWPMKPRNNPEERSSRQKHEITN